MRAWRFIVTDKTESDLDRLTLSIRKRVLSRLKWLISNFDNVTSIPLGGKWKGFFKLRVGDWRIVYEVETAERLVTVHYVDHRRKIYKRR